MTPTEIKETKKKSDERRLYFVSLFSLNIDISTFDSGETRSTPGTPKGNRGFSNPLAHALTYYYSHFGRPT